jgi:hypothetical protein
MQEPSQLERPAENASERLAAIIIKDKGWSTGAAERQRSTRPPAIQDVGQRIFVLQPRDAARRSLSCHQRQHRHRITGAPRAVERKLPIVAQRLQLVSGKYDAGGRAPMAVCITHAVLAGKLR